MKPHMQTLITLLKDNDLKALLKHYQASSESENLSQLAFLFQQGQKNAAGFGFYQQLVAKFIEAKGLPVALIAQINNPDILSFFTPALQEDSNFNQTNPQQRNVIHYLLLGNTQATTQTNGQPQPPFNYLRSMMLFESNETLSDALCQRDQQNFTPVEIYLSAHQNLTVLPDHEFTALLAFIEIESKKHTIDNTNCIAVIESVKQLCLDQSKVIDSDLQRLLLIATYYTIPIEQILKQMKQ